jgi:GH15 family glucan-1,4-alpha-glucosidase
LATGGIVAAATTSLPERLGGVRNWDYRYCWLRDATFTLLAFMNLGYYDEARAWRDWLIPAVAGSQSQAQNYVRGGWRALVAGADRRTPMCWW